MDTNDPGWNGPVITNITLTDCQAKRNGRSGFRCQETETLRIYRGDYDANDASGIQIEQETRDVIIDDASADNNSCACTGEAGFWVDEAEDVTLIRCVASNNHFGVSVSQSDDVTIDDCWIGDAKQPTGGSWGGLRVNTGQGITSQPFAGVRGLRVKNTDFWDNGDGAGQNRGAIYYGDTEGGTSYSQMEFSDNKVNTNCKTRNASGNLTLINPNNPADLTEVEFDPNAAGYDQNKHQPLSFESF